MISILATLARYNYITKPMKLIITSNGILAYNYAIDVIKGRWHEGEKAISKSASAAYYYAVYCIHGPWPEAEPAIASPRNRFSYLYAYNVLKDKQPHTWAERYIKEHGL